MKKNARRQSKNNNQSKMEQHQPLLTTKVEDDEDEWFANSNNNAALDDRSQQQFLEPEQSAIAITIHENGTNNNNNNTNNNSNNNNNTSDSSIFSFFTNNITNNSSSGGHFANSIITSYIQNSLFQSFSNAFASDDQQQQNNQQEKSSRPPTRTIVGGFLSQYFVSIDEKIILSRIVSTVYKPFQPMNDIFMNPDLYGPLMTIFSFAILMDLFLSVNRFDSFPGAVMSFALSSVLIVWTLFSLVMYVACRMLSVRDTNLVSVFSTVGYSMFPLLIVGCLSVLQWEGFKILCALVWLTIGVLSALNLGRTFMVRTPNKMNALIILGLSVVIQMICVLAVVIQMICVLVVGGVGAHYIVRATQAAPDQAGSPSTGTK